VPKYKNCKKVTSATNDINFDLRHTEKKVAGISKYTAHHTPNIGLKYVTREGLLNSIECLKLLLNLSFTLRK